ncbi:MAG: hypothetical protein MJZ26_08355 [Fibrobacter sp.]|nr:hypothetical protein [Fibrobacter sp.]
MKLIRIALLSLALLVNLNGCTPAVGATAGLVVGGTAVLVNSSSNNPTNAQSGTAASVQDSTSQQSESNDEPAPAENKTSAAEIIFSTTMGILAIAGGVLVLAMLFCISASPGLGG